MIYRNRIQLWLFKKVCVRASSDHIIKKELNGQDYDLR